MRKRLFATVAFAALLALGLPAAQASAADSTMIVPPITQSLQPDQTLPSSLPSIAPAPSAAPNPVPSDAPNPSVNGNLLSSVVTTSLSALLNGLTTAITVSVNLGVKLYVLLSLISIGWAVCLAILDSTELTHYIRIVLPRLIEFTIFIAVIENTWSGIGWLPAIISAGAAVGAQVGGLPGSTVAITSNPLLSLATLPQTMINLGVTIYSAVTASVTYDNGGWWGTITGAFTGQTLTNIVVWLGGIATGAFALLAMLYIAFRIYMSIAKLGMLAVMSFLQGFAGSKRLSPFSGGFLSGSIVFAVELALTVAIAGIFYNIINTESGIFHSPFVTSGAGLGIPVCINAVCIPISAAVQPALKIGALILLDATVAVFVWAVKEVPRLVNDAISGKLTLSGQEALQILKSSNSAGLQTVGYVGGIAERGSREGVGGALGAAAEPLVDVGGKAAKLAMLVGVGVMTGGAGLAAVGEAGMVGGLLGGGEGAVAAGLGKLFASGAAPAEAAESGEIIGSGGAEPPIPDEGADGSVASDAGQGRGAGDSARQAAQRTASDDAGEPVSDADGQSIGSEGQVANARRRVSVTTDVDDETGTLPSHDIPDDNESVHRKVTVTTETSESGASGQSRSTKGKAQVGGSGDSQGLGSGQGGRAALSAGDAFEENGLAGMMRPLMPQTRDAARMFAYQMIGSRMRERPPAPPPNEESAVVSLNLLGR